MAWAFLCFDWAMSHTQDSRALPRPAAAEFGSVDLRTLQVEGASRETHTALIWCQGRCAPADYIAEELAEKTRRQHSRSVLKLVTWVEFVLWNWEEVPRECWSWTGQTQRRLVLIRYLCRIIETYCHAGLPSWPLVGWGRDARETAVWTVFSRVGIPCSRRKARLGTQHRNKLRLVGCRHS